MFSLFPQLLWMTPVTFVLMRVAAGIIFGYASWKHVFHGSQPVRALGILELILAVGILLGAWTQAAAALGVLVLITWLLVSKTRPFTRIETALVLIMCVSLVITGAGPFAIDLPL